ncbi:MAG: flagellar biosynthesis anti-sigma factor FlgM [Candidatus Omnitrophota bacterium]
MKISADGIDKISSEILQRDLKRIRNSERETATTSSEDRVEISSRALDLKAMHAKAKASPDVRTETVNQIKMQIDNGTYRISHDKIAEQLIAEAMEG